MISMATNVHGSNEVSEVEEILEFDLELGLRLRGWFLFISGKRRNR